VIISTYKRVIYGAP